MKTNSILIKNAEYLVTMDSQKRILRNASLYIETNKIKELDTAQKSADTIIDATGKIVLPGFINCHHHMFQSLFRNVPKQQNQKIDKWVALMCTWFRKLDEEAVYYSALTNMAELILSGCTTSTDFFYIIPKGKSHLIEETLKAARDIGIRFHQYRGSMSLSEKDGALFDDEAVQDLDTILDETQKLIEKYHETTKQPMIQIGLGPCSPFTSPQKDYKESAKLARELGTNMQTHLAESENEIDYLKETSNSSPVEYLESVDWVGEDVSLTHCVFMNENDIEKLSQTKTNVVHCPISNARGAGIAPVTEMLQKDITIGIGVDGSAGNDSSNILEEMRWARTLQGAREGFTYLKPAEVLEIGTLGGAKLLRRTDIGSLEVGKAADVVIFDTRDKLAHAGAIADPIGSLIASQAIPADTVIINGRIVVEEENLLTMDLPNIIEKQNKISREIQAATLNP